MSDSTMKRAFDAWEDVSREDGNWYEYESRRKAILDEYSYKKAVERRMKEAVEQGLEQGKELKAYEVARNLLKMKMDLAQIAEATGVSIEELKTLQQDMNS